MALRVLLADESTSIKKVMQLALQDFGVEVKSVPLGIDVVPVARSWNPDIVFIDVLLAKKSGYEVCSEIKGDPKLTHIPTVLIWSSFMEIDESKASSCGAARRLEKPFDAETLRGIVKDLVPNTSSNAISSYLSFPQLPDFVEKQPAPPVTMTSDLNEVDEPEEFSQVPLPKVTQASMDLTRTQITNHGVSNQEAWTAGSLDRFKINIPKDDFVNLEDAYANVDDAAISLSGIGREIPLGDLEEMTQTETMAHSADRRTSAASHATTAPLDPAVVEQILREQVRAVMQDIGWKIIPDIAERIVREEIQKLFKDAEKLS